MVLREYLIIFLKEQTIEHKSRSLWYTQYNSIIFSMLLVNTWIKWNNKSIKLKMKNRKKKKKNPVKIKGNLASKKGNGACLSWHCQTAKRLSMAFKPYISQVVLVLQLFLFIYLFIFYYCCNSNMIRRKWLSITYI